MVCSTLANVQCPIGWFSVCTTTRSPTAIGIPVDVLLACQWASLSSMSVSIVDTKVFDSSCKTSRIQHIISNLLLMSETIRETQNLPSN